MGSALVDLEAIDANMRANGGVFAGSLPSLISPSSPNLEEQVKSTGRMISTPAVSLNKAKRPTSPCIL